MATSAPSSMSRKASCRSVGPGAAMMPAPFAGAVEMDAVCAGLPGQLGAAHHVVEMRHDLADGEAGLMGVERAVEQDRDDLGGGFRLDPAGIRDLGAALPMMLRQLVDAPMQPVEGQVVAGQHEG